MPKPSDFERTFGFEFKQPNGDESRFTNLTNDDILEINTALDYLRRSPDWTIVKLELTEVFVWIKVMQAKLHPPGED